MNDLQLVYKKADRRQCLLGLWIPVPAPEPEVVEAAGAAAVLEADARQRVDIGVEQELRPRRGQAGVVGGEHL